MALKLVIFCPFRNNFNKPIGSNIRIQGYTDPLNELGLDYKFLSPCKPDFVPGKNFSLFNLQAKYKKLFLLHNVLYASNTGKPISFIIYKILISLPQIKNVIELSKNYRIISHQENSIILFLYLRRKLENFYDVHGILKIQKEYMEVLNLWKKFWFNLELYNEILTFKYIPYLNVVSKEMKEYIRDKFNYTGTIFLAPDGLLGVPEINNKRVNNLKNKLKIKDNDQVLMFIGSFKKIGGVHLLVDAFIELSVKYNKLKLFLIGDGQMKNLVLKRIQESDLNNRLIYISAVPYTDLFNYMQLAEIIVNPDISNVYNEMTPHIKLFDCIASRRKIVAPAFEVNINILPEKISYISFFEPSNVQAMINSIENFLNKPSVHNFLSDDKLIKMTYNSLAKIYYDSYNDRLEIK